jgi:hypothetical protein
MEIVRYILLPMLADSIAGLVAVAGLLALDVGSLRTLIIDTQQDYLAAALLCSGFMATFGSAAIGGAVMSLGED